MRTYFPTTLDEVFERWKESPDAAICAGGTDLMVAIRQGLTPRPNAMIFLENIPALKEIRAENGGIFIGACATHTAIANHPSIQTEYSAFRKAIEVLGSPPIRNMGTIGGNICTASPAGDTLPPLLVLGAEVEIRNREETRIIPIDRLFKGPKQTVIKPDEILTGVRIKKPEARAMQHYEKVGQRKALAIAVVSMAALIETNREGVVEKARFAWGSVAPTVAAFPEIDQLFEGRPFSEKVVAEAAERVQTLVAPIDDIRATAAYRRRTAGKLLLRLEQWLSIPVISD